MQSFASKLCMCSHYKLSGWWYTALGGTSIVEDDVDAAHIFLQASWHVHHMFLVPYVLLAKVPIEPPDGCIKDLFYCVLFAVASTIIFTERLVKIYQVRNNANHISHKHTRKEAIQARKQHTKTQIHAFTTQYSTILASQIETSEHLGFAPNCDTVVCNNSANAHICRHRHMFVGKIGKIDPRTGVATIGGEDLRPSGIGTVKWSWDEDEGRTHHFFSKKQCFFEKTSCVFPSSSSQLYFTVPIPDGL